MGEPEGTPDGVDAMYEAWVSSLKRDKASASRTALIGWALALVLLVALVVVFAAMRREQMAEEDEELEEPETKEDDA